MRFRKIHYCCHFGFIEKQSVADQRKLLKLLVSSPVITGKYDSLGLDVPEVTSRKGKSGMRLDIGAEKDGLCISTYGQQLNFCINQTKTYNPTEKDVYTFISSVLEIAYEKVKLEGFLLRGIGILDQTPDDYPVRVQKHFFNSDVINDNAQFKEFSYRELLEIAGHPFRGSFGFKSIILKKSKLNALELSYDLLSKPVEGGMSLSLLIEIFEQLMVSDYFSLMQSRLPDAKA